MSWIQKLYETYNNCQSQIGYSSIAGERPLLPICHTTNKAEIEIVIDQEGNFRRANLVTNRDDATTIIPCSEASAGRTSKIKSHPLCDKLQYVAGDLIDKQGNKAGESFQDFLEELQNWCQSDFSHPKVEAVLRYASKQRIIADLAKSQILYTDDQGRLLDKKDVNRDPKAQDIFSVSSAGQDKAFVRWIVEDTSFPESRTWYDKSLWESWISYYLNSKETEPVCYVTGKESILTNNHPKYIRREGDSAKLISSNDKDGYTFRGRFTQDDQVYNLSLEVSHKAHYALSWLISRQGYRVGDLAIVAWASSGRPVPQPSIRSVDLFDEQELQADQDEAYTAQNFALKLNKKIRGYKADLGDAADIQVIALDSATTGRLSITYYRELAGSDYLQQIERWHRECSWIHDFGYNPETKRPYRFIGAPSPYDIAEAAYGRDLDENLRKATISRILPCIIDGQSLPRDLVISAVRRATKRIVLEAHEWKKALSVACALFKKYHIKEKYDMALDLNRTTRDYLYGRLLALADDLEGWAQSAAGEQRPTNATRLMQRFSEHPFTTWRTIELALIPYQTRLGPKAGRIQQTMNQIMDAFEPDDFVNDKPLSGEFLLGFHTQKEDRWKTRSDNDPDSESETEVLNNLS